MSGLRGRPPLPPERRRSRVLDVPIQDATLEDLARDAASAGTSTARHAAERVLAQARTRAESPDTPEPAAVEGLQSAALGFNDLVYVLNAARQAHGSSNPGGLRAELLGRLWALAAHARQLTGAGCAED